MADVLSSHSMLTAYNALAVRSREDPSARRRFAEAPRDALAAYGWELPEGTRVKIEYVEPAPGSRLLDPDQIVAVWRRGIDAGELTIRIADEPPEVDAHSPPDGYPS